MCTAMIEKALFEKQALVILDAVDDFEQLDALIGKTGLCPQSKIIITTKDGSLTEKCASLRKTFPPIHKKHQLFDLTIKESLRLLCWHAFGCDAPKEGYEEEVERLDPFCGGHPLTLKVLGGYLINKNVATWRDVLKMLKAKEFPTDIHRVLRISFDSLPSENCKELFKHIACFFVGADIELTEGILKECGIYTSYGITELIDRNLLVVSAGRYKKLMMHQLVADMGRDLVHQESRYPWMRTRLWNPEECLDLMKNDKGTSNIQGLSLDMRMLKKEALRQTRLSTNALRKMDKLLLLRLNHVNLEGSYKKFPEGLRFLCMHGFRLEYIPSELPIENLVALDMRYSNLKRLWKHTKLLMSLKFLNLSYCMLVKVGGFSSLPSLERLILVGCESLIEVCESIGECGRLVLLDLSYCRNLKEIPSSIRKLHNLQVLSIDCCIHVGEVPIEREESIRSISLASSSSFTQIVPRSLKSLFLLLPASLEKLSLEINNLVNESFPADFSSLTMLKELNLDGNPIHSLPDCVRSLSKLEKLSVERCFMLKSVLRTPSTVKRLYAKECLSLKKISFHPNMSRPPYLFYKGATSLIEIDGLIKFQDLAQVNEEILFGLGWTNLQYVKRQVVKSSSLGLLIQKKVAPVQMCYEFGIFSTCFLGNEVPNWVAYKSNESSISFTMPSSPMNKSIQGLNICFVYLHATDGIQRNRSLLIKVRNVTKNLMWVYWRWIAVLEADEGIVWLSHWIFGHNELEDGDEVIVSIFEDEEAGVMVKECGISLVYNDRDMEEDPFGYYKLWKWRIGGDLSDYQLTSGDYFMFNHRSITLPFPLFTRFILYDYKSVALRLRDFLGYSPHYKRYG